MPSSRRRFQFRLRTLLILVALLAVVCWAVTDRVRLIRERDEARAAVNRAVNELRNANHFDELHAYSIETKTTASESEHYDLSGSATKP
jgi:hypothetical protein